MHRVVCLLKILLLPFYLIWKLIFVPVRNIIQRFRCRSTQKPLLPLTLAESQRNMKFAQKFRQLISSSLRTKQRTLWTCIVCEENNSNDEQENQLCKQLQGANSSGDADLTNNVVSPSKPKSILKNTHPPLSPASLRKLTKTNSGFLSRNKSSNSLINEVRNSMVPSEYSDVRSSLSSTSSKSKRVTFNEDILESLYEADPTSFHDATSHYPLFCERNRF